MAPPAFAPASLALAPSVAPPACSAPRSPARRVGPDLAGPAAGRRDEVAEVGERNSRQFEDHAVLVERRPFGASCLRCDNRRRDVRFSEVLGCDAGCCSLRVAGADRGLSRVEVDQIFVDEALLLGSKVSTH